MEKMEPPQVGFSPPSYTTQSTPMQLPQQLPQSKQDYYQR